MEYVKQDHTFGAVMITAPWGSGKSYFIKNIFPKNLSDHSSEKCVMVSLYSLINIEGLCKAILMESKFKAFQKDNKSRSLAGLIGKTVYHGISSYIGFDLGASEKDYLKFFKSFNFSNNVIILDDLERTEIPMRLLMGFVSNLTEEGIKVILIANEKEIIDNCNKSGLSYDGIKEKTVCDTFQLDPSADVIRVILETNLTKISDSIELTSSLCQEIIELFNILHRK